MLTGIGKFCQYRFQNFLPVGEFGDVDRTDPAEHFGEPSAGGPQVLYAIDLFQRLDESKRFLDFPLSL